MQKKDIKIIVIIFIITMILELTIFNINSYRVLSSKNSKNYIAEDFKYLDSEKDVTLFEINNINDEIKTIHIEIENYEIVKYKFLYTDETTSNFQETPEKVYVRNIENSKYIPVFLSRK